MSQAEARAAIPRGQLAVALAPRDTADAREQIARAATVADLAELRLDLMESFDLEQILADHPLPLIVTYRPRREGGRFDGDEQQRLRVLRHAAELGAEYLDLEHDAVMHLGQHGAARVIVSRHDYQHMPGDLNDWWTRQRDLGADIVKVVGTAHDPRDNLRVLELLERADTPTIALCMGPLGLPSRVLGPRARSCFLTFAALDERGGTAPGQVSVQAMRDVYRVPALTPATRVYGVLTDQGDDTAAAAINAILAARDTDAVCVPWVAPTDPTLLLAESTHLVRGFAVAPAWQRAAFQIAREHDAAATREGRCDALVAVVSNGISGYAGRWLGNLEATTDWWLESASNPIAGSPSSS